VYTPFEDTSATWVDTVDTLEDMLRELKAASEIAVDLEHHDNRSYIGIVCLMQISTRDKDWIIDTLKLRDELFILNEVFTNPKIVKVVVSSLRFSISRLTTTGSTWRIYGRDLATKRSWYIFGRAL